MPVKWGRGGFSVHTECVPLVWLRLLTKTKDSLVSQMNSLVLLASCSCSAVSCCRAFPPCPSLGPHSWLVFFPHLCFLLFLSNICRGTNTNAKNSKSESFPKCPCHTIWCLVWASPLFLTLLLIKGSWVSLLLRKRVQSSSASFNHLCRWKPCQGSFFCWKPCSRTPLKVGQGHIYPSPHYGSGRLWRMWEAHQDAVWHLSQADPLLSAITIWVNHDWCLALLALWLAAAAPALCWSSGRRRSGGDLTKFLFVHLVGWVFWQRSAPSRFTVGLEKSARFGSTRNDRSACQGWGAGRGMSLAWPNCMPACCDAPLLPPAVAAVAMIPGAMAEAGMAGWSMTARVPACTHVADRDRPRSNHT